jgi:hypothetical protein
MLPSKAYNILYNMCTPTNKKLPNEIIYNICSYLTPDDIKTPTINKSIYDNTHEYKIKWRVRHRNRTYSID